MGLIGGPKTSVSNNLTPRKNPEDGRIQFSGGRPHRSTASSRLHAVCDRGYKTFLGFSISVPYFVCLFVCFIVFMLLKQLVHVAGPVVPHDTLPSQKTALHESRKTCVNEWLCFAFRPLITAQISHKHLILRNCQCAMDYTRT